MDPDNIVRILPKLAGSGLTLYKLNMEHRRKLVCTPVTQRKEVWPKQESYKKDFVQRNGPGNLSVLSIKNLID